MNVDDMKVEEHERYPGCRLKAIFDRQTSLIEKYHVIEQQNGLLADPNVPVDLHSREGQAVLKDYAWRVCEEMGEASAALEDHPDIPQHYLEELMDALHFHVELCILSGMDYSEVCSRMMERIGADYLSSAMFNYKRSTVLLRGDILPSVGDRMWMVGHGLSRAMNCLKNKPWKQSHMLTDVKKFHDELFQSFMAMFWMLEFDMSSQEIYEFYVLKNKVNEFRIESNY